MTFTHALLFLSHLIAGGAGYYLHYKLGAMLSKDAQAVRTAVQDIKKP